MSPTRSRRSATVSARAGLTCRRRPRPRTKARHRDQPPSPPRQPPPRPPLPALAVELAGVCALVVTAETRYPAFAAPVAVPSRACPSDHLVAFLGRDPETMPDPI